MAGDSKPAPANESKDKTDAAAAQPAAQPQLSALEEDDEFEEFPAQGKSRHTFVHAAQADHTRRLGRFGH